MVPLVAGALVFLTSAVVLVLEILAARLVAPYVGITLEAYSAIIGTVLAGIAAGTWVGGHVADRVEPRKLLGPLLVAGGALSMATVPLVRLFGGYLSGGGKASLLLLCVVAFFAPAAVLSAVTPTVVKLQLRDLRVTGRVVGRISALGTAGAIVGTLLAGFVLIEVAPTTTAVLVIGALVVALGMSVWIWLWAASGRHAVVGVVLTGLVLAGAGAASGNPCHVETIYHCVRVLEDPQRPGGRTLVLDALNHSYVDVDDPAHLEFRYTNVFADVAAAVAPAGPLGVIHVGGGGFTMPRYLDTVRPGSTNVVLEIDPGLVELSRKRLALRTGTGVEVRVGDARLLVDELPPAGSHLVLGDAFGGMAVPWHLTTLEFAQAVRSRLRPGGAYLLNIIDHPPLRFARAEVATLLDVFPHVAVLAPPALLNGEDGGNFVLVASDHPLDGGQIGARIAARRGVEQLLVDGEAAAWAEGAPVLTDDHAPVDQWLARARGA